MKIIWGEIVGMIKLGVGVLGLRRRIEGRGFRLHAYGMIRRFWG